jgi:putative colanic acid biosynthesis acetyltransferase WcaF
MKVDIASNRAAKKWSRREQLGRVAWAIAQPFFRLSPRVFWSWRCFLLRLFGADIAADVHLFPTVTIAIPWNLKVEQQAAIGDRAIIYNLGRVTIGAGATISQGAHLCAGSHDYRRSDMPLLKLPVHIERGAWICADAFVGPGVTVGEFAIVGARAVAMRNVAPGTIVAGNPCKVIGTRPAPVPA